jgi:hypothetical protein
MSQDISEIRINIPAMKYITSRWLQQQYIKAERFILSGNMKNVDLKLREPKSHEVWYFRINKQYRALCKIQWNILYVVEIDNHQN